MAKKARTDAQLDADKRRSKTLKRKAAEKREEDAKAAKDAAVDAEIAELAKPVEAVPDQSGLTFTERQKKTTAAPEVERVIEVGEPEPDDEMTEMRPEFQVAVNKAMELLDQFIVYEKDAPEEARIMFWPGFTHLKQEDINALVMKKYNPGADVEVACSLEDLKLMEEGISDSISILKKRTDGAFPSPGERPLSDLELTALCELSWTEAATFYRMQPDDLVRGYIQVTSRHGIKANQPPGSRNRQWISVQKFAKMFIDTLSDETTEDMVAALIEASEAADRGYAMYLLRWREKGLI